MDPLHSVNTSIESNQLESDQEHCPAKIKKSTSLIFERRIFENIGFERDKNRRSASNFTHLNLSQKNDEIPNRGKKNKIQKCLSEPDVGKKKFKVKKLHSSDDTKYLNFNALGFTERELIQPISTSNHYGNESYKPVYFNNLKFLNLIDESKESQFNKTFQKELKIKLIKDNKCTRILPAEMLEECAMIYFEKQVTKITLSKYPLTNIKATDLFKSELERAKFGLVKLQKNGVFIQSIIPNLLFLQQSILDILHYKYELEAFKTPHKSKWINCFFKFINSLISSLNKKEQMNPLKTFTYRFETEIKDKKMVKLIIKCLKVSKKEFEDIMNWLLKWSDFKILKDLKKRVSKLDRKLMKDHFNISLDNITAQRHEWFESLDSKMPLNKIKIVEIIRCFIPDSKFIFDKFTINKKTIIFNEFDENPKKAKLYFFTQLLYEIYSAGYNKLIKEDDCKAQSLCLISIVSLSDKLKKYLSLDEIPWEIIQNILSKYEAVPFYKLKKKFNAEIHLDQLDEFLIELTIPCINVLRLCVNSCWSKAHDCINYLYDDLFIPFRSKDSLKTLHSTFDPGIECHIHIKDSKEYSVTQIKKCSSFSATKLLDSSKKDLFDVKTTFSWTVSPYNDAEVNVNSFRGLLRIRDVEINPETSLEIKTKILTILNNPIITDFVQNSLNGTPKIISTF